jgi:signal peptidase II
MSTTVIRLLLLVTMTLTIACDRSTKRLAATTLAGQPARVYLAGCVRLEYAENEGAFLGIGANWPSPVRMVLFGIGSAVPLLAMAFLAMRRSWPTPTLLGLTLIVAGGVSNLLDRFTVGVVVDFMMVEIGAVRTGIFNVADVAITVGALVVVVAGFGHDARANGGDQTPPKAEAC